MPGLKQKTVNATVLVLDMRAVKASSQSSTKLFVYLLGIDLNRLRRYRALEFRPPVTQGKHSVKRSLYKALHKRPSLVLRR